MKKVLLLVLLLIASLSLLISCGDDAPETDETYRVMVGVSEGFTVTTSNPLEVKKGESAQFFVKLEPGYVFVSTSHGTYDELTGKLKIDNVTSRISVQFTVENLGYDTNTKYVYSFKGTDKDTTTPSPSSSINAGTKITVTAGDHSRIFVGWTFGKSAKSGADIVSTDREYTFRISPDVVENGALVVYANYTDSNIYYYDPNGGELNVASRNMAENEYYQAKVDGNRVKVTLLSTYYDFAECASLFWDDSTFTRDGYVLKEYNTKPDGSGEAYSLGSKFYANTGDDSHPVLYCIWSESAPAGDFTVSPHTMEKPSTAKYAPDWCESGLIITSYNGNAKSVTVPETIGGKKVIAIASGAFMDKNMTELILPKTIQLVENRAFIGCSSLTTLYFPNSIYQMYDEAFDAATYSSFTTLIVNATMAPRYSHSSEGAFAVKLSRFLAARDEKKVIVISGSSTYQGLSTEYMEALFDGEYTVINFGTTRPRPGLIYLEALSHYTDEDDIFVYAPENSSYMMGEGYLSWRLIRDLEGMNNLYRYVNISNYYGYFSSMTELNQTYSYTVKERKYEEMCKNGGTTNGVWYGTDKNGDYQNPNRESYLNESKYIDSYYITLNNRFKSMNEGTWNDVEEQAKNKDYTDLNNPAWQSIDTPEMVARMNYVINKAKASGAGVYFGFAPADAYALVEAARSTEWILAYDKLIMDLYDFDGLMGSAADYVYNHKYFYDCAFHVNDYGRAYRTYNLYVDVAEALGLEKINGYTSKGTDFDGCLFEEGSDGTPLEKVDFLD